MLRCILVITLIAAHSAALGATGSITGRVVDKATQEPLIVANVVLMDTRLGAATDLDGKFFIEQIELGSYNVKILMMGYRTLVKTRVVVKPGKPTHLEIELEEEPIQMAGLVVRPTYFENTKDAVVSSMTMDFEEIITQPGGGYDVQRAVQALPAVVSGADQNKSS